jgi:hypothetical protein
VQHSTLHVRASEQKVALPPWALIEPIVLPAGWYSLALVLILVLSAASQLCLHLQGLYSISADESARTLMARNLRRGLWRQSACAAKRKLRLMGPVLASKGPGLVRGEAMDSV